MTRGALAQAIRARPPLSRSGRMESNSGTPLPFGFLFIGHVTLYYLDYIDIAAQHTLVAIPGHYYSMLIANRFGLQIPPADGRWLGGASSGSFDQLEYAEMLHAGRQHNATLRAQMIREPVQYVRHDGPIPEMKPARRPDTLAEARAVNARLHIRMARGEKILWRLPHYG